MNKNFQIVRLSIDSKTFNIKDFTKKAEVKILELKGFDNTCVKEISSLLKLLRVEELIFDSWKIDARDAWFSDGLFDGLRSLPAKIVFVNCEEEEIEWIVGNLIEALDENNIEDILNAINIEGGKRLVYNEDNSCWWLTVED